MTAVARTGHAALAGLIPRFVFCVTPQGYDGKVQVLSKSGGSIFPRLDEVFHK